MTNDDHNELESLLREVRELLPKCRVCLLADFHEVIQRAEAAGDFEAVITAYIWLLRPRRKPGRRREAKQAAQEPAQGPKGRTPPKHRAGPRKARPAATRPPSGQN